MGTTNSTSKVKSEGAHWGTESSLRGSKMAKVRVCSSMVGITPVLEVLHVSGVHHFILVEPDDEDYYIIHEWGSSYPYLSSFKVRYLRKAFKCFVLSNRKYSLEEVYKAAQAASRGREYKLTKSNCNHWTERVVSELGWKANLNMNCRCVSLIKCKEMPRRRPLIIKMPPVTGKKKAMVRVCGKMNLIDQLLGKEMSGANHFILLEPEGEDYYIIHEWGASHPYVNSLKVEILSSTFKCLYLGKYTLDHVHQAVVAASRGRKYNLTKYNCNHWTERVVSELGRKGKLNSDCECADIFNSDRKPMPMTR